MKLIKFNDSCVVERKNGKDKYDNPIVAKVYQGECLYQETSATTSQGMNVYRANLFIPNKTQVKVNDFINIKTANHEEIATVIENVDFVSLSTTGETITVISLKQGFE